MKRLGYAAGFVAMCIVSLSVLGWSNQTAYRRSLTAESHEVETLRSTTANLRSVMEQYETELVAVQRENARLREALSERQ